MNRCLRAFAWMLMLHAVFALAADATGGMGRYRVRFAEHVIDTGQAASRVLAICRCRQEPYAELGFTGIVVMASPAAANLLSRDPRVAAVEELSDEEDEATMPAAPPVTAAVAPPSIVIAAPVGPDAHSKFEVLGPYEYDGSRNIRKIGSSVFVYDAYGRVVSGQAAGRTQTYTYDRYGNQVSKTTDGSRSDFPADGATNRMNGATYDGAGRLRSYPGLGTYTFDSLDTLTASTVGAGPAVYVYNAGDERIVTYQVDAYGRELSSEWTLRDASGAVLRRFLKSADGKWSWDEDYIYLDGRMLAAEVAGPHRTLHFHLDHLGTPRLITNHTGAVVSEHAYFPFGEEASSTTQNTEKKKFTGHERDNVGQDYMHARYYTGYWGRFLSVDPGPIDAVVPQMWNRYSYALNNPLKYIDPTGEVVDLSGLTSEERSALLLSLNSVSGNEYGTNNDGHLTVIKYGDGASPTATSFLDDAIVSTNVYEVNATNNSSAVNAMNSYQATGAVNVDFADFRATNNSGLSSESFGLGSNLIHELVHVHSMLNDPPAPGPGIPPSQDAQHTTGPVVDFVNRIHRERGLPERGPSYAPANTERTIGGRVRIPFIDPQTGRTVYVWPKLRP